MRIAAFWHLFAVNHWAEVAAEQLMCLRAAKFPFKINVGLAAGERERIFLLDLAQACGVELEVSSVARDLYEYPTLCILKESAVAFDACLYFHGKAVSHPGTLSYTAWRWSMNYQCLAQWRARVADIEAGYDAVGMALQHQGMTMPGQIFAGNFWWAGGPWVRNRPIPEKPGSRFLCEDWLLCGDDQPRVKSLVSVDAEPHRDEYYTSHGNPHLKLANWLSKHVSG